MLNRVVCQYLTASSINLGSGRQQLDSSPKSMHALIERHIYNTQTHIPDSYIRSSSISPPLLTQDWVLKQKEKLAVSQDPRVIGIVIHNTVYALLKAIRDHVSIGIRRNLYQGKPSPLRTADYAARVISSDEQRIQKSGNQRFQEIEVPLAIAMKREKGFFYEVVYFKKNERVHSGRRNNRPEVRPRITVRTVDELIIGGIFDIVLYDEGVIASVYELKTGSSHLKPYPIIQMSIHLLILSVLGTNIRYGLMHMAQDQEMPNLYIAAENQGQRLQVIRLVSKMIILASMLKDFNSYRRNDDIHVSIEDNLGYYNFDKRVVLQLFKDTWDKILDIFKKEGFLKKQDVKFAPVVD